MFSRLSLPGIVMEDMRSLSVSLLATSLIVPVLGAEAITLLAGLVLGSFYGYRIEKHIHEFRSLGGRIMKGRSWDYLILA